MFADVFFWLLYFHSFTTLRALDSSAFSQPAGPSQSISHPYIVKLIEVFEKDRRRWHSDGLG